MNNGRCTVLGNLNQGTLGPSDVPVEFLGIPESEMGSENWEQAEAKPFPPTYVNLNPAMLRVLLTRLTLIPQHTTTR